MALSHPIAPYNVGYDPILQHVRPDALVSTAYRAVEQHARKRLLQWLWAKHKLVWPAAKRFPEASLHEVLGLVCLTKRTSNFPWTTS